MNERLLKIVLIFQNIFIIFFNTDLTPRGKAGNPFKVSQNSSASKTGAKGTGYFETLESQHSYKTKQGKTSTLDIELQKIVSFKSTKIMIKNEIREALLTCNTQMLHCTFFLDLVLVKNGIRD